MAVWRYLWPALPLLRSGCFILLPANGLPAFGAGVHFYCQPLNQTHDTSPKK
jgi:hypothetical protein